MAQDYPYIRKWGAILGSNPEFIRDEVEHAKKTNAPSNAVYWSISDRCWRTTVDITNPNAREELGLLPKVKKP